MTVTMQPPDHHTSELLRAVAMPSAKMHETTMANLVAKITCWEQTIESARLHGILPLLYARLRAMREGVPPRALDLARREFERNAFHCFANAAELLEVVNAFTLASIPSMPFKGVALASSAYGDITLRAAGDLDLLIYARDLKRGTEILEDRGYELKTPIRDDGFPVDGDHFELHFERPKDGMVVELRWRLELTKPRFRRHLGMEWVWPKRVTVQLAGAAVPGLDPVSALLVLCMHGSKHTWSRLIWISDVARHLESQPQLDWEFAELEAKHVGLWRCMALGVLLAKRMAGSEVPSGILRRLESDRGARRLSEFFAEHLPAEPGRTPAGRIPYNLMLLDFMDRVRLVLSPAILRPNERDRAVIRLPRALYPLYYLVRPFRVLRDRTARQ